MSAWPCHCNRSVVTSLALGVDTEPPALAPISPKSFGERKGEAWSGEVGGQPSSISFPSFLSPVPFPYFYLCIGEKYLLHRYPKSHKQFIANESKRFSDAGS